jgi:DHA2 family multidrug resistance protein
MFAMGIAGLQLMLDRGETLDWFSSTEVIVEAVLAALGLYLFVVHLFTGKKPFITPAIFKDRNLNAGLLVMFAVGLVLLAVSALLAPWLQDLGNYSVESAGLMMAPRGIGTMIAMMIVGRLTNRIDARVLMAFGILVLSWSLWRMTGWTPAVAEGEFIVNTIVQGFGLGFVFIPLQVIAFATLKPELRTEGTALLSLLRNVGSAVGISITEALLIHNTQVEHAALAKFVSPLNRAFASLGVAGHLVAPATSQGQQVMNGMITQQAQIVAYADDFKLMLMTSLPMLLLLLIMRRPKAGQAEAGHAVME